MAIGLATSIEVNDGVANAFQAIPDLIEARPPNDTVRTTESRRLGTPVVVRVPTRTDPGTIAFKYESSRAVFNRLNLLKGAQPDKTWKFIMSGTTENFAANGFLMKHNIVNVTAEEIVTVEAEVQMNSLFASIAAS